MQTQTNRRKLGIGKGSCPGCSARYFSTHPNFVFGAGYTLNVLLGLSTRAKFPRNAAEVLGAVGVLQRRSVQVDILAGELSSKLPFPKRNEDLCLRYRLQIIRLFGRSSGAGAPPFSSGNFIRHIAPIKKATRGWLEKRFVLYC